MYLIKHTEVKRSTFTLVLHTASAIINLIVRKQYSGGGVSPFLHQSDGGLAEQVVREQVDLSHGVGQAHRQLLTQEHVRCFLTSIVPA